MNKEDFIKLVEILKINKIHEFTLRYEEETGLYKELKYEDD